MAIGTMAAIGLAAAGVGAAVSSGNQKSAANKAADTSAQVAAQNNALAANIYSQNQAALAPFMQRGNAAGNQINALLGLGGVGPTYSAPQQSAAGYAPEASLRDMNWQEFQDATAGMSYEQMQALKGSLRNFGNEDMPGIDGRPAYQRTTGLAPMSAPSQTAPGGITGGPQQAANNAFDIFRNSTGYQFRLGEGMNALNSGLASSGVIQSGAAMKEAQRYGQNFASNEFGNYMGYLGNQQGTGLAGASALAGVATNYGNNVQANNQNAADARGNAFLIAGQNNPFANALGMIGGGMFSLGR